MKHIERILQMRCRVCRRLGQQQIGRTYAHHVRIGQGMAQRAQDELAVPLCWECHQGDTGIHGDRSIWLVAKMDEADALADTIQELCGNDGPPKPHRPYRRSDKTLPRAA